MASNSGPKRQQRVTLANVMDRKADLLLPGSFEGGKKK